MEVPDYPFLDYERQALAPRLDALRGGERLARVRLPYAGEAWLAVRYAHVRAVLSDPRFSRAAAMGPGVPRQSPEPPFGCTIMDLDRPEHGRLRRLVAPAFADHRVEELRPFVRQAAAGLVSGLRAGPRPADLVEALAQPLPMTVIARILGVPQEDRAMFRGWAEAVVLRRAVPQAEFGEAVLALESYLRGLVRHRRTRPSNDLLSVLVSARDGSDRLTEPELISFGLTVLAAGLETTASQIANSAYLLLTNPVLWQRLLADPGRLAATVDELIRLIPLGGGAGLPRVATEDVELGGVTVRAGEAVFVSTISANRDEETFPNANGFDDTRRHCPHLAFGYGAHRCLGERLATIQIQEALLALVSLVPGLVLGCAEDAVRWKSGSVVRGPLTLPVYW